MKNIKVFIPEKYNTEDYCEIIFGVYKNIKDNTYCFCFEADHIDQYPLEDLLDQYDLNCAEYYGEEVTVGNEKKTLAEVETLSDNKDDFIKLMNFTTIVGKEIVNFSVGDYVYLGVKYADSSININDIPVKVPIIAYRSDFSGMTSFEVKYPEIQYKNLFTSEKNFSIDNPDADVSNICTICLKEGLAKMINENGHILVFNEDGFIKIDKSI